MMKILFAGGGSLGHVTPCVAVWRALERIEPGSVACFACSYRNEDIAFLREENLDARPVAARRLRPWTFLRDFPRAWILVRRFRPDAVFCKGGAVSVPVALAAWMMGIPVVLHDSDAVMGRSSALISRIAKAVCRGMPAEETGQESGKRNSIFTGNPVRSEVTKGSHERGLFITGIPGDRAVLLVYGGSQGAETLNAAVREHLDKLLSFVDIIHLTGKGKEGKPSLDRRYYTAAFAHKDLPHLYAASDIALSRSGAGAISELAANGIPTIFVPLPGLAQDHQTANAKVAERWGGGITLPQSQLQSSLVETVRQLLQDGERRNLLKQKWESFVSFDAAERIAHIVQRVAEAKRT